MLELAMAAAQPKVLNRASTILPSLILRLKPHGVAASGFAGLAERLGIRHVADVARVQEMIQHGGVVKAGAGVMGGARGSGPGGGGGRRRAAGARPFADG
jgi:hypothetical protein